MPRSTNVRSTSPGGASRAMPGSFRGAAACSQSSTASRDGLEKKDRIAADCISTLMTPLPSSVALKNVQNGMRNWPHASPQKSNSAFGQLASASTAKKPCRFTAAEKCVSAASATRALNVGGCRGGGDSIGCDTGSGDAGGDDAGLVVGDGVRDGSAAAAYANKYGGISPTAVPAPQRIADAVTFVNRAVKGTCILLSAVASVGAPAVGGNNAMMAEQQKPRDNRAEDQHTLR